MMNDEPEYLRPLDPALAAEFDALSPAAKEHFAERAGVLEWMGQFHRQEAEARAMEEIRNWLARRSG